MKVEAFEKELTQLINRHSIENMVDMPDYLLAGMICRMIEAMGPSIKKNLDWHGCDSVCHPFRIEANTETEQKKPEQVQPVCSICGRTLTKGTCPMRT